MDGRTSEFTKNDVIFLLTELGRRLEKRGVRADVRLVGGAAVMLSGSDRRRTRDIDAAYAPVEDVDAVVAEMAAELDLPRDWLNSSASAWIPAEAKWLPVRVASCTAQGRWLDECDDSLGSLTQR